MNSAQGGLSNDERQKQAAAAIARRKVVEAYENAGKLKDEKKDNEASRTITRAEWQKYHSAWQNYYQKYYNNYYSNAAKEYLDKEKQRLASISNTNNNTTSGSKLPQEKAETTNTSPVEKLRQNIRKKASDAAKTSRRRQKLIPIFAGLAVVFTLLFLQYNRLIFAPIAAYVSPGEAPASEITAVDPTVTATVSPDPKLIVPKLNIEVPVAFGISLDEVMPAMNRGVAHYRINGASAFPGEIGNTVITGHSAGDIYSNNQYKFIFSGLERLEVGDLIYVNYNSTRYTYRMTKSEVIEPTNVAALVYPTDKPILTLITCTPLGTSRYRLLITAEQISPNLNSATSSEAVVNDESETDLPSNEPSFFENLWKNIFGEG